MSEKDTELTHVQQLALLDEVEKIARKLLDAMGFTDKIEVRSPDADETHCDPLLGIGAFYVSVQNVPVKALAGHRLAARYHISHEVTIPGCHSLPNGDPGYPDDSDLVDDLIDIEKAENAAARAVAFNISHQIDHILQMWDEDKMAKEMEKEWENMGEET